MEHCLYNEMSDKHLRIGSIGGNEQKWQFFDTIARLLIVQEYRHSLIVPLKSCNRKATIDSAANHGSLIYFLGCLLLHAIWLLDFIHPVTMHRNIWWSLSSETPYIDFSSSIDSEFLLLIASLLQLNHCSATAFVSFVLFFGFRVRWSSTDCIM